MIVWFQCTAFDVKAFCRLPAKLRERFALAREHQMARELEDLPGFTPEELDELESRGIQTKLSKICPRLLNERERDKRRKATVSDGDTRVGHAEDTCVTRVGHAQRREEKRREEKKREEEREGESEREAASPPAPLAPAPPKRKPSNRANGFGSWEAKPEHGDIAKQAGVDLTEQVELMRDWLLASGKTYKDYDAFARNWLRRAKPAWKPKLVPTKAGDRAPDPAEDPDAWLPKNWGTRA